MKAYQGFDFIGNKPKRLGMVLLLGMLFYHILNISIIFVIIFFLSLPLLGFGWCILSLIAAVVLGLFDKRAERITKRKTGDGTPVAQYKRYDM